MVGDHVDCRSVGRGGVDEPARDRRNAERETDDQIGAPAGDLEEGEDQESGEQKAIDFRRSQEKMEHRRGGEEQGQRDGQVAIDVIVCLQRYPPLRFNAIQGRSRRCPIE